MSSFALLPALAAATGGGADSYDFKDHDNMTFTAVITGAPTAVTIVIEGNNNGSGYFPMATHVVTAAELTLAIASFAINGISADRLLYNITVLTAGTSPTVDITGKRV